jgi:hypothetical protein
VGLPGAVFTFYIFSFSLLRKRESRHGHVLCSCAKELCVEVARFLTD